MTAGRALIKVIFGSSEYDQPRVYEAGFIYRGLPRGASFSFFDRSDSDPGFENKVPHKVVFLFIEGGLASKTLTFSRPVRIVLGRDLSARPRFPDHDEYRRISRRHCLVEIKPPEVQIRDLGSMNGTWVNERLIGRRVQDNPLARIDPDKFPAVRLSHGDEFRLGKTVIRVEVYKALSCSGCGAEINVKGDPDGPPLCQACREGSERTVMVPDSRKTPPEPQPPAHRRLPVRCLGCDRKAAGDSGFALRGLPLCPECRKNPRNMLEGLLARADRGEKSLAGLAGLKIFKELGRGTSGAVFLAQKTKNSELTAVKVLLPEIAVHDWGRESFLREVENAKVLNHPNVVRLDDSGSYRGLLFYTMEYCDAGSLRELVTRRGGKLPVDEAMTIILQALEGLEYIHQAEIPMVKLADNKVGRGRGLVHRDLKPANIFLSGKPGALQAKIADVGVAKVFETAGLSGLTRTGTVAGSPVSMPRQQVINFKYARPDVDVWAMAATLYLVLTGFYPRHFPQGADPFRVVLTTTPVPIRERNDRIPEKLASVIDRALIDNPAITFQRAVDFRQALLETL